VSLDPATLPALADITVGQLLGIGGGTAGTGLVGLLMALRYRRSRSAVANTPEAPSPACPMAQSFDGFETLADEIREQNTHMATFCEGVRVEHKTMLSQNQQIAEALQRQALTLAAVDARIAAS
jgi:hypothetical protein